MVGTQDDYFAEREEEQSGGPIFSSDLSMSLVNKELDIRNYSGDQYIDLLLGEVKAGVDFKPVPKEKEYGFGKLYDFDRSECEVFPSFNYQKLDADTISMHQEVTDLYKVMTEPTDPAVLARIKKEKEAEEAAEAETASLEARLTALNPDMLKIKKCDGEADLDSRFKFDEEEVQENGNKRVPTLGLKKLSVLSWLAKRRDPGFKASRNLRQNLEKRGVKFNSFKVNPFFAQKECMDEDEESDDGRAVWKASRNLRNNCIGKEM